MASQNLPGFAVLRASGYQPPTPAGAGGDRRSPRSATAFLGAHTSNLAAISAALCTGPEAHPDPAKRWIAGPFYALWWGLIALFGASLVGLFGALPPALLTTVAGTALLGSMAGALGSRAGAGEGSLRRRRHAGGHRVGRHADGRRLGVLGARVRPAGPGLGKRAQSDDRQALVQLRKPHENDRRSPTVAAYRPGSRPARVRRRRRHRLRAQAPVREITQDRARGLSLPQQRPLLGVCRHVGRHHRHRSRSTRRPRRRSRTSLKKRWPDKVDQVRGLQPRPCRPLSRAARLGRQAATVSWRTRIAREPDRRREADRRRVPQVTFCDRRRRSISAARQG